MHDRYRDLRTTEELLQLLREDAGRQDRWPTRFILVSGLALWRQVIAMLRQEASQIIQLSTFCQDADTLPYLPIERLTRQLKCTSATQTLILPVGELLRLHAGLGGALLRTLATLEHPGRSRVYVPLWQAQELLEEQLQAVTRWRSGELPPAWRLPGSSDELQVCLTPLPVKAPAGSEAIRGLRAYLEKWETGGPRQRLVLVETAFARAATPSLGRVDLRVCRRGFEVVREFLRDSGGLEEKWGTAALWDWLAQQIIPGEDWTETAARLLNVRRYDFLMLLANWPKWPPEKRWLFWLWSKTQLPGRYARAVLASSQSWEEFVEECWLGVWRSGLSVDQEILEERRAILEKLAAGEPPLSFWQHWEAQQEPFTQLRLLTGLSQREKIAALTVIQRLLQEGQPLPPIREALELAYPELAWYLATPPGVDEKLAAYLEAYHRARLLDQGTPELYSLAEELAAADYLWQFAARHQVLEAKRPGAAEEIWLDGCGVEWLGFITAFCHHHRLAVEVNVARANLPSITATNQGWPATADLVRDLDQLAHSYDYRFPQTFVKELEWLKEQLERIASRLAEVPALILTADHGLSRYLFHKDRTLTPPAGAEVDRWGRCARIREVTPEISANPAWQVEPEYLSLKVYGRFQGGSGAVGEVHGGATLEEALVPVLVLRRPEIAAVAYQLELLETVLRFDVQRTATLGEVRLTPDPGQLYLWTWDRRRIPGRRLGPGRYAFTLTDLQPGEFRVWFEVQGQVISEEKITITSAAWREEDLGI